MSAERKKVSLGGPMAARVGAVVPADATDVAKFGKTSEDK